MTVTEAIAIPMALKHHPNIDQPLPAAQPPNSPAPMANSQKMTVTIKKHGNAAKVLNTNHALDSGLRVLTACEAA